MTPEIAQLRVYPFKSCGPLEVQQGTVLSAELPKAVLTPAGIETVEGVKDHWFMFVRAEAEDGVHKKITQRDRRDKTDRTQGFSDMVHIRPQFHDGDLYLTWDGEDPIVVPLDNNNGNKYLPVELWEGTYVAADQGNEVAEWASAHLTYPVRLVKASGPFGRFARQNYMNNTNPVRMQDGYPVHWFAMESVEELNVKAQEFAAASGGKVVFEQIAWESLRPQMVATGMPAQYEHTIHEGAVSGVVFKDPKPCGRCTVTKVDQHTGTVNKLDPNAVLAGYKFWLNIRGEPETIFGENMLPKGTGTISVGDPIEVFSFRDPALQYGAAKRRK